jgi:hypothetical protein
MSPSEKSPKTSHKFYCEYCDYKCCKQSEYNKHTLTTKHKNLQNPTLNPTKKISKTEYNCSCGKAYKHSSTFYAHKKKCNGSSGTDSSVEVIDKDQLILMLINQNAELIKETTEFKNIMLEQQNMMMKVIENGTNNTTNNITSNTNSHNKAFNLNFFLNETCKDAMNIMDFVDSIKLQLSDLEGVGELGYVEGISSIIVKNLKELDITQRPVHCTDKKRETMYIKDEDKWEKDEEKKKLHKVVRKITCKNQNLIPTFKEKHPDCNTYHSKFSDQYNKIIIESMGGKGDNDYEKEEKIIKNISKQVFIDKEQVL